MTRLADQQISSLHLSLALNAGIAGTRPTFETGAGDPNSDFHTGTASVLRTETFPQSPADSSFLQSNLIS